jgi:hypothetical protein
MTSPSVKENSVLIIRPQTAGEGAFADVQRDLNSLSEPHDGVCPLVRGVLGVGEGEHDLELDAQIGRSEGAQRLQRTAVKVNGVLEREHGHCLVSRSYRVGDGLAGVMECRPLEVMRHFRRCRAAWRARSGEDVRQLTVQLTTGRRTDALVEGSVQQAVGEPVAPRKRFLADQSGG